MRLIDVTNILSQIYVEVVRGLPGYLLEKEIVVTIIMPFLDHTECKLPIYEVSISGIKFIIKEDFEDGISEKSLKDCIGEYNQHTYQCCYNITKFSVRSCQCVVYYKIDILN